MGAFNDFEVQETGNVVSNAECKEAVIRTVGELANMRGEDDDVWRTLYAAIDLARALDIGSRYAEIGDVAEVNRYSDKVEEALQAIACDVGLWRASVSRATPREGRA